MDKPFGFRPYKVFITAVLCLAYSLCAYSQRAVRKAEFENNLRGQLVEVAESQVGVREATGNNDGKEVRKYLKVTGLPEGNPWCAAFVSWVFEQATTYGPRSARVTDWFKANVIWKESWGEMPFHVQQAQVGALYYKSLGRYGHIVLIVGEDKNNFYTIEGNTNAAGSREGQGVYKKIRSKSEIAAIADYCLVGNDFINRYGVYIESKLK